MNNDYPKCDACGGDTTLEKSGHVNIDGGSKCRIRRFKCTTCDTIKTIYANGYFDEDVMPQIAKRDQKKLMNQQTDYEKNFL